VVREHIKASGFGQSNVASLPGVTSFTDDWDALRSYFGERAWLSCGQIIARFLLA
jgi:hypothetical protein